MTHNNLNRIRFFQNSKQMTKPAKASSNIKILALKVQNCLKTIENFEGYHFHLFLVAIETRIET